MLIKESRAQELIMPTILVKTLVSVLMHGFKLTEVYIPLTAKIEEDSSQCILSHI